MLPNQPLLHLPSSHGSKRSCMLPCTAVSPSWAHRIASVLQRPASTVVGSGRFGLSVVAHTRRLPRPTATASIPSVK